MDLNSSLHPLTPSPKKIYLWVAGGVLALALYAAFLPAFFVGYFNDDALYVLGAKALWTGQYVALEHPRHLPLNDPLPGYPLLLAPFVQCMAPSWSLLKAVPIALTLLSAVLLGLLLQGACVPAAVGAIAAIYAFNPAVALYSSSVMSESFFVVLVLALFLLLKQFLRRENLWEALAGGVILGWATLVRPQGIVLIPSIALGLAYERQWKTLFIILAPALTIWIVWLIRNLTLTHTPAGYLSLWQTLWPALSGSSTPWAHNVFRIVQILFADLLLAWPSDVASPFWLGLAGVVSALGLWMVGRGLVRLVREGSLPSGLCLAVYIFCFLYAAVHSFWLVVTDRYFLPLLPFLIAFGIAGIPGALPQDRTSFFRWKTVVAGIIILGFYGFRIGTYVSQINSRARPSVSRFPEATFQWIDTHTSPYALFLSPAAPLLYLYTGRHALRRIPAEDKESFRYRLLRQGVTHLFFRGQKTLTFSVGNQGSYLAQSRSWADAWPEAFPLVYRNDTEASAIFAVLPDARFVKAYDTYLDAMGDLQTSQWSVGQAKLSEALKVFPSLASAYNASGVAYMLQGNSWKKAEIQLLAASRLQSDYKQPLLNLASLYHQMGREDLSRQYYEKAAQIP